MSGGRPVRRVVLGLLLIVAGASMATQGVVVAAASHPWHDAIAEVRVVPDQSRLEVSMRVDGPHLEAIVADWSGTRTDLDRATGGSADELRLAAYVRASMGARFVPTAGPDAAATPPADRFDFHWYGREFEGTDCWIHFQWVAPPAGDDAGDDTPRAVQVRSTLLIEPHMQQVNTVSVLEHAAVTFSAGRTDWSDVDLALPPRRPMPLRVARAGEAGPRVLVVPGPAGPGGFERRLAARLRNVARVEIAFWPGTDGEAPPPSAGTGGRPWTDWVRASLGATLEAAHAADDPVVLILTHPAAQDLLATDRLERDAGIRRVIRVAADDAVPGNASEPDNRFDASVLRRYRTEVANQARPRPRPDEPREPPTVVRDVERVADAAISSLSSP